jgi:hypothetical protein
MSGVAHPYVYAFACMSPMSAALVNSAFMSFLSGAPTEYERAEEHIGRAFSRMHITWF